MAEMTWQEAVEEVEKLNWGGVSFKTEKVIAFIQQQAQTIEAMKCCGNCENFETVCGEGKCFVDCDKPAWRYDKKVKYADGSGKCDQWQVKEGQ